MWFPDLESELRWINEDLGAVHFEIGTNSSRAVNEALGNFRVAEEVFPIFHQWALVPFRDPAYGE